MHTVNPLSKSKERKDKCLCSQITHSLKCFQAGNILINKTDCSQFVHYLKYFQTGNVLKKFFNQVKKFCFDVLCLVNLSCSLNGATGFRACCFELFDLLCLFEIN